MACFSRLPVVTRTGQLVGTRTAGAVLGSSIDLLPTLADLAGVKLISEKPLDGTSLAAGQALIEFIEGLSADLPVLVLGFSVPGERLLAQLYQIEGAMLAAVVDYLQLLAAFLLNAAGMQNGVHIGRLTNEINKNDIALNGMYSYWKPI